eukprot:c2386_g1_i2.p1 GENE.c2386_g1_i2~~c2386_g1_i2.p1  ORF type:complete len:120 (-),score=13.21 c2386_g1_i2:346-705(-)
MSEGRRTRASSRRSEVPQQSRKRSRPIEIEDDEEEITTRRPLPPTEFAEREILDLTDETDDQPLPLTSPVPSFSSSLSPSPSSSPSPSLFDVFDSHGVDFTPFLFTFFVLPRILSVQFE